MSVHPFILFLITFAAPARAVAAPAPYAPIRPESRVWITGSSNIRRFTCTAHRIGGTVDLRGIVTPSPVLMGENASPGPSLDVAVDKLDCGIGVMNRHLREALRGAAHPSIAFRLTTYEVDLNAAAPGARIAGVVTIAGVARPVTADATVRVDSLGVLHVQGTYVVRPTAFGVAPPRRFGGLLRVRNRATVHFDIALDPDGGTIDTIGCLLLKSGHTDLTREATHASHS